MKEEQLGDVANIIKFKVDAGLLKYKKSCSISNKECIKNNKQNKYILDPTQRILEMLQIKSCHWWNFKVLIGIHICAQL